MRRILLITALFVLSTSMVWAQDITGVASSIPLSIEEEAVSGQIICQTDLGFKLCSQPYSAQINSVVVLTPSIGVISTEPTQGVSPVISNGSVQVLVSAVNGAISAGDYITASTTPGVGMRANRTGFVLGISQEDWSPANTDDVTKITVSVQPKLVVIEENGTPNLFSLLLNGIDLTYLSPTAALRYFLAVAITLASMIFAFWFFARSAQTGIRAIGRNPLAGKSIQIGILLNVIITVGVMSIGLGIAYLLLIL